MKVFAAVFLCLLLASCGAKTKTELIAEAKMREEFTVNKNYQEVYRGIADKFVECMGSSAQHLHRNIYSELGTGEFYFNGADAAGYVFLIDVKKVDQNSTSITAYSKIAIGMYPKLINMVRYVTEGKEGCPK